MQRKLLSTLFVLSFVCLLSGCASAPDVPLCVELDIDRGHCVHTISSTEYDVDDEHPFTDPYTKEKYTWWALRPLMVHMPAASWAEIKAFIIKMCKRTKDCDRSISNWERSVQTIDSAIELQQR